jgi:hypothetical protein
MVWAGGYAEAEGMYEFSIYVELQQDDSSIGDPAIVMRTPSDPARVSIAVARIPIDEVDKIMSG